MDAEVRAQLVAVAAEAMQGFLIEERPERVAEAVIDALQIEHWNREEGQQPYYLGALSQDSPTV